MTNKLTQERLPLIRCQCGEQILLIPDVKAMDKAIEAHLNSCTLTKHSKNRVETKNRLCGHLIKQVLDVAATEVKDEAKPKRHLVREGSPLNLSGT